ncbi:MAG: response regulator, partial [Planctomycetota bacterium]
GIFARAPRPDLILLDLLLPDGEGQEFIRQMRCADSSTADADNELALESEERIPIVVLTASDDDETRRQCESLNVDNYMCKPVSEEEFLRVIRQHKHLMLLSSAAQPSAALNGNIDFDQPIDSDDPLPPPD